MANFFRNTVAKRLGEKMSSIRMTVQSLWGFSFFLSVLIKRTQRSTKNSTTPDWSLVSLIVLIFVPQVLKFCGPIAYQV